MKAFVVNSPGGPEVLKYTELPNPLAVPGKALIKIKAFGLNRAEAITRMGGSFDAVKFPKVIGIECVGEIIECPGGELPVGQKVACAMGEMGRAYNGSYAEMVLMPLSNVFPVETNLDWTTFGSIPETYFTAWGCCFETLQIKENARIVVRPGASALGLAIAQIVNHLGGEVIGVTRSDSKVKKLKDNGMRDVIVSSGSINDQIRGIWPEGATGVIDTIVSETTVLDDHEMLAEGGRICLAGSLADSYGTSTSANFAKVLEAPHVNFFRSDELHVDKDGQNLQTILNRVSDGSYQPYIDAIYPFEKLVEAHQLMDKNAFAGKVVIEVNG